MPSTDLPPLESKDAFDRRTKTIRWHRPYPRTKCDNAPQNPQRTCRNQRECTRNSNDTTMPTSSQHQREFVRWIHATHAHDAHTMREQGVKTECKIRKQEHDAHQQRAAQNTCRNIGMNSAARCTRHQQTRHYSKNSTNATMDIQRNQHNTQQ